VSVFLRAIAGDGDGLTVRIEGTFEHVVVDKAGQLVAVLPNLDGAIPNVLKVNVIDAESVEAGALDQDRPAVAGFGNAIRINCERRDAAEVRGV
jgi:hypothetical protein